MKLCRSEFGVFAASVSQHEGDLKEELMMDLIHGLPIEDRLAIAHRLEQLIYTCWFAGNYNHSVSQSLCLIDIV